VARVKAIPGQSTLLVLAALLGPATPRASPGEPAAGGTSESDHIAFVHAAVIPMNEEHVLGDQTVVVTEGTIVEVGPTATTKAPDGALVVDATGRYLLPAFCDMHVHLLGESWNMMLSPEAQLAGEDVPWSSFLLPYVANGVTTVQDLFGPPELLAVRERIARGEILGPRLILARMIDGPGKAWPPPLGVWVASPTEARDAVRRAKEEGYDKIKVYSFLNAESYDAIVATAKELGMDVIGHIPFSLSVDYVLEAGQKLIAHSEEVAKHAGGDHRPERVEELADMMAKRGVWMMPTLVTTESIIEVFDDPAGLVSRPEVAYYRHPMEQGVWSFVLERLYEPIPSAARQSLRDAFDRFQRPLTVAFHERGGKMMAGSDTVLPGLVPGFALHRELRELVGAGLTPFEALQTATTAPFDYLGEGDLAGTIEVGRRSDLVLLDENPLEDISNSSTIAGVLIRGRWLGAEEIRRRMQELARSFEEPSAEDEGSAERPERR
jgi:imidazolonepropionase-like amidohydrolase